MARLIYERLVASGEPCAPEDWPGLVDGQLASCTPLLSKEDELVWAWRVWDDAASKGEVASACRALSEAMVFSGR